MGSLAERPRGGMAHWPIVFGFFTSIGGILFGYDTGTISGIQTMPYWERTFAKNGVSAPTSGEISLIVSILSVGTFVGALGSWLMADFFGRRWSITISCLILFNPGVILQTVSTGQTLFIIGRLFAGLGVGLVSGQVPLYQSETMPKWIRGAVVGSYQLCINIGLFIAACIEYGTSNLNNTGSYRIPIAIQFLWALVLAIGMIFLPESPRWLVMKQKPAEAAKAMSRVRNLPIDHPDLQAELNEMERSFEHEMLTDEPSYIDCFRGSVGKRLLVGSTLQALQQLSGINFIFYFGTSYFKEAGFQNNPFTIQMIITAISIVSILPGLYAVDKYGRRAVLLLGSFGMSFTQIIIAIVGTVITDPEIGDANPNTAAQKANIFFVCFYVFFFEASWGPCAWTVTGEMFPLYIRAKCLSITTASNWLLNFIIAFFTPYLTDVDKANLSSKVFFIWASFCIFSIFFVWAFIYETKNLTLEQVSELYQKVDQAWKSKEYAERLQQGLEPSSATSPVKDIKGEDEPSAEHADMQALRTQQLCC